MLLGCWDMEVKKKWEVGNFFSIKLDLEKGAPPYFLETATFANGFVALKMRLACKCPRSTNRLKIIFFQIDVYLSIHISHLFSLNFE